MQLISFGEKFSHDVTLIQSGKGWDTNPAVRKGIILYSPHLIPEEATKPAVILAIEYEQHYCFVLMVRWEGMTLLE